MMSETVTAATGGAELTGMVVVFGSLNADLIFPVALLPGPGQTLMATGMTIEPGGKGANQAAAAALDGAPVVMVGAVGQDALAVTALSRLEAIGADVRHVARMAGPTGCASICTDREGRNQIVVASGANVLARADAVTDEMLNQRTVLVTQMENDPAETASLIRRAAARGARIVHNLAPAAPFPADVLRLLDLLVLNEDEAEWLARHEGAAGDDAASLHACLGITVVRTLGSAGVEWCSRSGGGTLPAAKVTAVDTTAAGDCFVGVLAAALYRGDSLQQGLSRATVAAGLACTRHGSQGSLPGAAETDATMAISTRSRQGD